MNAGFFSRIIFIERPTARMLEAVRAENSTRTNQKAVFVLVVRDR